MIATLAIALSLTAQAPGEPLPDGCSYYRDTRGRYVLARRVDGRWRYHDDAEAGPRDAATLAYFDHDPALNRFVRVPPPRPPVNYGVDASKLNPDDAPFTTNAAPGDLPPGVRAAIEVSGADAAAAAGHVCQGPNCPGPNCPRRPNNPAPPVAIPAESPGPFPVLATILALLGAALFLFPPRSSDQR